jgi:hypothetical protein
MKQQNPFDFDIDVDLSSLLGIDEPESLMVNDNWYLLGKSREGRPERVQQKIDKIFRNAVLEAQWRATARRALDRRRAVRAPLISRVHMSGGLHLVATDISLSGLRCSGEPRAPLIDIEFKLPNLAFPIDARAEVVSYKDSDVIPLVGLRFLDLEKPYRHHIAAYVNARRAA